VLTVSTQLASDRVVYRPDCLGLLMFYGLPSVYKGRNAVRVPPRAQCFPQAGGLFRPPALLTLSTPCQHDARGWPGPLAGASVQLWLARSRGPCFPSSGLGDVLAFHFFMVLTGRSNMTRFASGTEVLCCWRSFLVRIQVHGDFRGLLHDRDQVF
jgi:hypothetical protein